MSAFQLPRAPTAFSIGAGKKQKSARVHDDAHLRWLRTLPCIVSGKRPVEAAHIRFGSLAYGKFPTGGGEKPSDKWAVPLHPDLHREQHSGNEELFWAKRGLDPLAIASALFMNSGDDAAAETIINESVARAATFLGSTIEAQP